jgi:hypothetical protein
MSKVERIRRVLDDATGVSWQEQAVKREHLRHEGQYYRLVGIQVWSAEPILKSSELEAFSDDISQLLIPVGPVNITKCYEYAETRRDVIKTAALYFTEKTGESGEENGLESRITVSIYPCREMAENLGIRGTIDIGHYECSAPCQKAGKCGFWSGKDGFFHEASR